MLEWFPYRVHCRLLRRGGHGGPHLQPSNPISERSQRSHSDRPDLTAAAVWSMLGAAPKESPLLLAPLPLNFQSSPTTWAVQRTLLSRVCVAQSRDGTRQAPSRVCLSVEQPLKLKRYHHACVTTEAQSRGTEVPWQMAAWSQRIVVPWEGWWFRV